MRNAWLPLLLAATLAACSSSGPVHPPAELESLTAEIRVDRLWNVSTSSSSYDEVYVRLQPAIADGVLYAVGGDGDVRAFALDRGKRLWKQDYDVVVSAGLGLDDQRLYFATAEAQLYALKREDGSLLWQQQLASEVLATPVVVGDNLIVHSADGTVEAFDVVTGKSRWQNSTPVPALSLRGDAEPVPFAEDVLIGHANGRLSLLNAFDGSQRWQSAVAQPQGRNDLERMVDVDATPQIRYGTVFAVAHQGRLTAISLETGRLLWSRDIGSAFGMVLGEDYLYLVDDSSQVWALDLRTGASLWKQDKLLYRQLTQPAILEGALLVGDFEGYVHWLALEDGRQLGRYELDEAVRVSPQVVDGVAYIREIDGDVTALRLKPLKRRDLGLEQD